MSNASGLAAFASRLEADGSFVGRLFPGAGVINGDFEVWRRGTSQTASGYGSADRFTMGVSGGTVTTSRQALAVGDTIGGFSPRYFLRQAVSGQSAVGHFGFVAQRIEGVRSYAGQTITLSFWARRSSGAGNIAVEFLQFFGTGGSPSATVLSIGAQVVAVTGAWVRYSVTIAIPSIAGKTLGSNGDDYLQFTLYTSAGTDLNARTGSLGVQTIGVDLWGIQIDLGAFANPYARFGAAVTELLCRRFYKSTTTLVPTNAGPAQMVHHNPPMARVPTVSGGGAGFAATLNTPTETSISQTTTAAQALVFDAEL